MHERARRGVYDDITAVKRALHRRRIFDIAVHNMEARVLNETQPIGARAGGADQCAYFAAAFKQPLDEYEPDKTAPAGDADAPRRFRSHIVHFGASENSSVDALQRFSNIRR